MLKAKSFRGVCKIIFSRNGKEKKISVIVTKSQALSGRKLVLNLGKTSAIRKKRINETQNGIYSNLNIFFKTVLENPNISTIGSTLPTKYA